jgi:hypothetical protein
VSSKVSSPLHARGIRAHLRIADDLEITRHALEAVVSLPEYDCFPFESVSTIRADFAASSGPANMARSIFT